VSLYVGTSGWAYKEWKPGFYPEGLPQASFLQHYATQLTACEINATFYRLQSESTFTRWAAGTPESFRFAAKAHRRLTHSRQIAPDGEQRGFLDTFLKSLSVFGPRLGVVLFQFPPYRSRDDDAFGRLLEALPAGVRYAFEFRHDSWDVPDVYDRIADFSGTVCMSDSTGSSPVALPPGPFAYVRLRTDRYDDASRSAWKDLLLAEAQDRDVFAFAKHEGIPTDDPYGGIGLAVWLTQQDN
jgi:uncharacterized protein YecE (DUF72 family)